MPRTSAVGSTEPSNSGDAGAHLALRMHTAGNTHNGKCARQHQSCWANRVCCKSRLNTVIVIIQHTASTPCPVHTSHFVMYNPANHPLDPNTLYLPSSPVHPTLVCTSTLHAAGYCTLWPSHGQAHGLTSACCRLTLATRSCRCGCTATATNCSRAAVSLHSSRARRSGRPSSSTDAAAKLNSSCLRSLHMWSRTSCRHDIQTTDNRENTLPAHTTAQPSAYSMYCCCYHVGTSRCVQESPPSS